MSIHPSKQQMPGLGILKRIQNGLDRRREATLKQRSRLLLETLEPRILIAADPLSYVANPKLAQDLSLAIIDKLGVPTIQMTETTTATVVLEKAVADTSRLDIKLSDLDDRIIIRSDFSGVVPVSVAGGTGSDVVVGRTNKGLEYSIDRANGGTVAGVTFTATESLKGQDSRDDSFVFRAGGSMSGTADGGVAGKDAVAGGVALTFTIDGANTGIVAATRFAGVERLQGGDGLSDMFILSAGGSISSGINGGAGAGDTLFGRTGAGLTYTIDRADGGIVAGLSFDGIENLRGEAKLDDLFVLRAGGSLDGAPRVSTPSG